MPRHILIAIDGSTHALKAARYGLDLAAETGALATAVIVTPGYAAVALAEIATGGSESTYAARMSEHAERCLAKVRAIAMERRVVCETLHVVGDRVHAAVLAAAAEIGADLLVVGAHGRGGIAGLLLGSETQRILAHSRLPVVVHRD